MKKFREPNIGDLTITLGELTQNEMHELIEFVDDVVEKRECLAFDAKKKYSVRKDILLNYLISVFMSKNSVENIYKKLSSSEVSTYLYQRLVWEEDKIHASEILERFEQEAKTSLGRNAQATKLDAELSLVRVHKTYYDSASWVLYIDAKLKNILRLVTPIPEDFDLEPLPNIEQTKYSYNNEEGVLNFISVIEEMLKNRLVEFGKTNEKPLAKSLNILKSTTGVKEFFNVTSLNSLATDMLTRSFYYYSRGVKKFEEPEQNALKHFVLAQFQNQLNFFITRIFLGHLKKVRYDSYYSSQENLFKTLTAIIKEIPKDDFVSVQNIIRFCKYRDLRVDIEAKHKVHEYYIDGKFAKGATAALFDIDAYSFYDEIVFEPMIKASLFWLGALGLVELKYNDPISCCNISAKDKPYISPWDSLLYIKLTKLGKYIFSFSDSYEYEKKESKKIALKFDEYKPIIVVDKNDTIMQAKLESYAEKQGEDRWILSHAKIFKDCKTKKILKLKIDGFYSQIESNPPQVFKDFFDEIVANADMLQRDLKYIVIELKNNKKLLELFMRNKKLQELVIKAQGYRVLVLKENLPKLTKIIKDNGFFVEF